MRNINSALRRIIGGGFALATATALVIPGIAAADEAPDTGSMGSVQGLLGSSDEGTDDENGEETAEETTETSPLGSLQALFGGSSDDTTETPEASKVLADEDAENDPMVTDLMGCFTASLGSLTGESEDAGDNHLAVVEDDEATNSIITCVLDAIGAGSGDSAETPAE